MTVVWLQFSFVAEAMRMGAGGQELTSEEQENEGLLKKAETDWIDDRKQEKAILTDEEESLQKFGRSLGSW